MNFILGMPFLYFPEDKTEYIPAAISFFFFLAACILTFTGIVMYSKKEEEKARELEKRMKEESFFRNGG